MSDGRPEGGASALSVAVDDFYDRMLADPFTAVWFDGVEIPRLKAHQRAFLRAALGGPMEYTGRELAAAHGGLNITDAAYDRTVEHLVESLLGAGIDPVVAEQLRTRVLGLRGSVVEVS